jgi:hypothetical protein
MSDETMTVIFMVLVIMLAVGFVFRRSGESFKNLGGLSPQPMPQTPSEPRQSSSSTDITLGNSPETPIPSQVDLMKMIDKGPKDMYGSSSFYRNLYYQDPKNLQKYLTINGMNHVSPDVYIRNIPINDSYKTNEDGYFYIRQPVINKQTEVEKGKGDDKKIVDESNPI